MTTGNQPTDDNMILFPKPRTVTINGQPHEVPVLSMTATVKIGQLIGEKWQQLPPDALQGGTTGQRGIQMLFTLLDPEKILELIALVMQRPVDWVRENDQLPWMIKALQIVWNDLDQAGVVEPIKNYIAGLGKRTTQTTPPNPEPGD
jgi:hypothetical protein